MAHTTAWASRGGEIYIEPSIENLTGWTAADIAATPSLGIIPPDHLAASPKLAQAHHRIHTYEQTAALRHRDGSPLTAKNTVVVLDGGDLAVGVVRLVCPILEELSEMWDGLDTAIRRCLLVLAKLLA